jgi:hypothetical protein
VALTFAQRREARLGFIVRDDPGGVAADGNHPGAAESVVAHANVGQVIVSRTVLLVDPLARANVVDALAGPGGPVGVLEVVEDGPAVMVRFDDAITASELVDDLVAIESIFVPARSVRQLAVDDAAARAAAGLGDPELNASRIIETYLGKPKP